MTKRSGGCRIGRLSPDAGTEKMKARRGKLTPIHLLRQLEPSWFRRGQTTSLLESVIEKEDVKEDRGGILTPPCAMACWRGLCSDKMLAMKLYL